MVDDSFRSYPDSGEINFNLHDSCLAITGLVDKYKPKALKVDEIDGISLVFKDWRFNLMSSNTEPVARLNVESR